MCGEISKRRSAPESKTKPVGFGAFVGSNARHVILEKDSAALARPKYSFHLFISGMSAHPLLAMLQMRD